MRNIPAEFFVFCFYGFSIALSPIPAYAQIFGEHKQVAACKLEAELILRSLTGPDVPQSCYMPFTRSQGIYPRLLECGGFTVSGFRSVDLINHLVARRKTSREGLARPTVFGFIEMEGNWVNYTRDPLSDQRSVHIPSRRVERSEESLLLSGIDPGKESRQRGLFPFMCEFLADDSSQPSLVLADNLNVSDWKKISSNTINLKINQIDADNWRLLVYQALKVNGVSLHPKDYKWRFE